ncbi:hypothetical protein F0345_28025 [Streptomyces rutgersensis]|uniref:Endonuclease/exonuclease/phosphatase domain-containing protein n=1 Tax=Streptomyces rutgersensis TaxID=53451 RepID=A0ABX6RVN3_9ACTN|nr:hypothetical protein [Streptomyces rutgersensis]QNE84476.1 hypothetical protein F0345_28025 [Streptomyces rutgersensis]WSU34381.1 hypothetical protein OG378_00355 [Streptomyces gougerotii]
MLGLYVPSRGPKDQRNVAKRAFQEAVTESLPWLLAAFPDMPVIVAGDLNVIERGHQPPHKVFGDWEYDFYDSFRAADLTDAFRHLHPDEVTHSWFGRSGNGFRFDHLFVSTPHAERILACEYHQEAREAGLSDHAVMTLRLGLPSTPGEQSEAQGRGPSDSRPPQRSNVGVSANLSRAAGPCVARVDALHTLGEPLNYRVRNTSERNRCSKSCGAVEHGDATATSTRGEHIDASRTRRRQGPRGPDLP